MAYSYIDYGGDGDLAGDQLAGTFTPTTLNYVSSADIYVTRTDTTTVPETVTTLSSSQFTVTTSPSLSVVIKNAASGGVDLLATDLIRIGRSTPLDALSRTFTDGSVLKASDLNTQNTQLLYVVQENKDDVGGTLPIATDGKYDAGGKVIKNLGLGVNDGDSVTLGYVNALSLYGSADGGVTPQFWSWTTASGDDDGTHRTFTLTAPEPTSAVNNMYIVEGSGVMQSPSTNGTDGDYDVTELGGTYTLKMLNASASAGDTTKVDNGVEIVIRNFGTTRNTLMAPYKAATTTSSSLEIEKITGQTGDFIKADDSSGTDYFRVEVDGSVLLGDGAASSTATTKLSTTALEIANQDLSGGDKHNQYGAVMQVLDSNRAHLSLQGNQASADGDTAFRVDKGQSDGSIVNSLYVTYGGAIVTTGAITATGTVTSGGFSTTAASTLGNVTLADGSTFAIGSSKMEITRDSINRVESLGMEYWGQDNTGVIRARTAGVPGGFGLTSSGPIIGRGGDGDGVTYGGHGSRVWTDGSSAQDGPYFQITKYGPVIGGFLPPASQGGVDGEDGTTPAHLRYRSSDDSVANAVTYANLPYWAVPCKKHVDQAVETGNAVVSAENKYELIGSHTFANDKGYITRATDVDWVQRYSQIKIIVQDVTSQTSTGSYRFSMGLSETTSGFGGDERPLHSSSTEKAWTVTWGGTSGVERLHNPKETSAQSAYGSQTVFVQDSDDGVPHEQWFVNGEITLTFGGTPTTADYVFMRYDLLHKQSTNPRHYYGASSCSCDTDTSKLYRLWFLTSSYQDTSGAAGNILSGTVSVYGIKR